MGFLEHLQSSLILGTSLDQPLSKNFDSKRIDHFFHILQLNKSSELSSMIENGFHVDTPHHITHETPLITALQSGLESLAIKLISYGANVLISSKNGESSLYIALKNNLLAAVELLINLNTFNEQTKKMQRSCFDLLSSQKKISPLDIYEYFQPNTPFYENIFTAAKKGEVQQVIRLLNSGISLHITNSKKQSLLHIAITHGSIQLVSFLLNRGIDVDGKDKFGNFPLIYATLFSQRINILKLLLKHNATINQMNHSEHSALTMAIRKQNIEAIDILCQAGADINHRDGIHTPLSLLHDQIKNQDNAHLRVELRRLYTYFMVHGAHVNSIGDKIGWTALQLTINYYDSPFYLSHIKKLMSLGADINYADLVGRTALMLAAGLGRERSVKLLVKEGAHIDHEDKYGWTALMLSVYNNHIDIVKVLLNNGANINLISSKQLSALKIAIDQKNTLMEVFLKERGAILDK